MPETADRLSSVSLVLKFADGSDVEIELESEYLFYFVIGLQHVNSTQIAEDKRLQDLTTQLKEFWNGQLE